MLEPLPLFGREGALADLRRALERHRWVTLWGAPGVGKSRLAQSMAPDASVQLTAEHGFWASLVQGLGVDAGSASPELAVARALSDLDLVVVDESDRAAASLRQWLPTWMNHCRFLVLSSGPLGGDDEHAVALPPLDLASAEALWAGATQRLGHRSTPGMGREVATRLDGLPLALMWFAGRAALLGDDASLRWLRRHGGDKAPISRALEHSLDGLEDPEREALYTVATFERGLPTPALEALNIELETVEALVRRALLRIERQGPTPRVVPYWLVRQRLRAKARETGRWTELCRRHAEHLLLRLAPLAADPETAPAVLTDERAELDAVIERMREQAPELALRAATLRAALALDDGAARDMVRTLEDLCAGVDPVPATTRLALARLERRLGRVEAARGRLAGVELFEARLERAHLDRMQATPDIALASYEATRAAAEGNPHHESIALGELGRMKQSLGRYRAAQRLHERAVALQVSMGLERREALERSLHARATHREGRVAEAVSLHERAIELHRRLGCRRLEGAELGHLGYCFHELRQHERAEACFRRSVEVLGRVGDVVLESIERLMLARMLADLDRLSDAQLELALVERAAARAGMPRLDATRHLIAGFVALGRGERLEAAEHWRAGVALGPQLEVGFEALLPLHLAWLEPEDDAPVASVLARVADVEAPGLALAASLWAAAARGEAAPEVRAELAERSSDVRRAQRYTRPTTPRLSVATDGRAFTWAGSAVSLGRRAAPRRLLVALVAARISQPGVVLPFDDLIEAGWPGERMGFEAARKRLRTAIWTLRKMGLGDVLLTRDDGYLIDPRIDATLELA